MTLYTIYMPESNIAVRIFNEIQSHCCMCVGLLGRGCLELIVVMDKQSIEHI